MAEMTCQRAGRVDQHAADLLETFRQRQGTVFAQNEILSHSSTLQRPPSVANAASRRFDLRRACFAGSWQRGRAGGDQGNATLSVFHSDCHGLKESPNGTAHLAE